MMTSKKNITYGKLRYSKFPIYLTQYVHGLIWPGRWLRLGTSKTLLRVY